MLSTIYMKVACSPSTAFVMLSLHVSITLLLWSNSRPKKGKVDVCQLVCNFTMLRSWWLWMMNWDGRESKCSYSVLINYTSTCLVEKRKITKPQSRHAISGHKHFCSYLSQLLVHKHPTISSSILRNIGSWYCITGKH
jgi:hypothetical protein